MYSSKSFRNLELKPNDVVLLSLTIVSIAMYSVISLIFKGVLLYTFYILIELTIELFFKQFLNLKNDLNLTL